MGKFQDLTGQKFNRLTALEYVGLRHGRTHWKCRCDCGAIKDISANSLKTGHTKSCGCLDREQLAKIDNTKHGMRKTRIYDTWVAMKQRCVNPNNHAYDRYGGRGITVCDEWQNSFEAFRDWAFANGYEDDLTIERVDNDGNYCPENCKWETMKKQANNRRSTVVVNIENKQIALSELSDETGINYYTLWSRYERGDRGERLIRPTA